MKMNLYDIFGGEELLKKPEYKDFYLALQGAKKISPDELANCAHLNNDVRIRSLFFKDGKAGMSLCASYVNLMPVICIYADIENADENRFGEMITASYNTHSLSHVYLSDKDFPKNEKALADALFAFIDEKGKFYFTEIELSAHNIITDEPVITDVQVAHPKSSDGKETLVSYARTSQFKSIHFDYDYPKNTPVSAGVKIMLPFVGSFKVSNKWKILGVETQIEPVPLMNMTFVNGGGTAVYNKDLASKIKIDTTSNTVSWNLAKDSGEDDWEAYAPAKAFGNNTVADMYACFSIKLQNIATSEYYSPVFTAESRAANSSLVGTTAPLKPIHFYLGCFAKDTKIRMADNTQKSICDIKQGDMVKTENGTSVVDDIIIGNEDVLIKIETQNGYIMVTPTHPLKTSQGYVRANDLNCAHKLILNDKEADVKFIYPEKYEDKVYNLILNNSGGIYANGFIAGDYTMQSQLQENPPILILNDDASKVVAQFKSLYEKLKK